MSETKVWKRRKMRKKKKGEKCGKDIFLKKKKKCYFRTKKIRKDKIPFSSYLHKKRMNGMKSLYKAFSCSKIYTQKNIK